MTIPAILLGGCAGAAMAALVLSAGLAGSLPRKVALASLWLALASAPASLAWDLLPSASSGGVTTRQLREALSHAKNYGVAAMPFAGIAMFALRRAKASTLRRGPPRPPR
jgi:hypothetical protein